MRGTVVTGRIESGTVRVGAVVAMVIDGVSARTEVLALEVGLVVPTIRAEGQTSYAPRGSTGRRWRCTLARSSAPRRSTWPAPAAPPPSCRWSARRCIADSTGHSAPPPPGFCPCRWCCTARPRRARERSRSRSRKAGAGSQDTRHLCLLFPWLARRRLRHLRAFPRRRMAPGCPPRSPRWRPSRRSPRNALPGCLESCRRLRRSRRLPGERRPLRPDHRSGTRS
jgi:hypothetical protein